MAKIEPMIQPMTADDIKIDVAFAYVVLETTTAGPWRILAERVLKYALAYAHAEAGRRHLEHSNDPCCPDCNSPHDCARRYWKSEAWLAEVLAGLGWKDGE